MFSVLLQRPLENEQVAKSKSFIISFPLCSLIQFGFLSLTKCSPKKEDWNALVRKGTVANDPIGSKRTSLIRKDRHSLRRHILATANEGLSMDTDKLIGSFKFFL